MRANWGEQADRNLRRMDLMVARLGVRPHDDHLGAMEWACAFRRCAFCSATKACEAWIRAGTTSNGYDDFCPNAHFFERERSA